MRIPKLKIMRNFLKSIPFSGAVEIAKFLIKNGAAVDGKGLYGFTPLGIAVARGSYSSAFLNEMSTLNQ